jgi:hypothetical protein
VLRVRPSSEAIRRLKFALLFAFAVTVYIKGGEYFAVLAFRVFLRTFPSSVVVGLLVVGYWRDQFKGR